MELSLIKADGSLDENKISVSDAVFDVAYNPTLVHQVVLAYMAKMRAGTKAQKNRSAVRGGGRKPWAQKGTGRARAGTIRSPLWRSGGVTFAAQPRDFTQKVNKKSYRIAMRSILSELAREQRLLVIEDFDVPSPKTSLVADKMKALGLARILLINEAVSENLYLASRNLHAIQIMDQQAMNPVDLVDAPKILITQPTLQKIEAWLT